MRTVDQKTYRTSRVSAPTLATPKLAACGDEDTGRLVPIQVPGRAKHENEATRVSTVGRGPEASGSAAQTKSRPPRRHWAAGPPAEGFPLERPALRHQSPEVRACLKRYQPDGDGLDGLNSAAANEAAAERWVSRLLSSAGLPVTAGDVGSRSGYGAGAGRLLLELALSPGSKRESSARPSLRLRLPD